MKIASRSLEYATMELILDFLYQLKKKTQAFSFFVKVKYSTNILREGI